MDEKHIGKILYHLSSDCRMTTKKLGRHIRRKQQAASYMANTLRSRGLIKGYRAVADPARLGLINVFVLYNFTIFGERRISDLQKDLVAHPHVITIDRVSQGADLLVEYSVPNLSYFNKQHRELLHDHKSLLQVSGIFVVIVKHIFERKYLVEHPKYDGIIICGDRDIFRLNRRQDKVLGMLHRNAKEPVINIARKLNLDPKTIMLLKKHLESRKIILRYTVTLDYDLCGIKRSYIFLQPAYEDTDSINKLINFTRRQRNITGVFKIIGSYELMLVVEKKNPSESVIKDIRKHFQVSKYWILESDRLVKEEYVPDIL